MQEKVFWARGTDLTVYYFHFFTISFVSLSLYESPFILTKQALWVNLSTSAAVNVVLLKISSHLSKAKFEVIIVDFLPVLNDKWLNPNSSLVDIHKRVGEEIPIRKIRKCLYEAVKNGEIKTIGGKKFRKYFIDKNME